MRIQLAVGGRALIGASAVMCAVARAGLAVAQPTAPVASPETEGAKDEEDGQGTTVRVQGTKRAGSASETTVERDVIRAAPHKTASDTLAVVPGVTVTQHSGQGKAHQIFFRGFDAEHGQ